MRVSTLNEAFFTKSPDPVFTPDSKTFRDSKTQHLINLALVCAIIKGRGLDALAN